MKIIVVAGPVNSGKSHFARYIGTLHAEYGLYSTDDYIRQEIKWDDLPGAVAHDILRDVMHETFIIEGVRALSVVYHNQWADKVDRIWWGERNTKNPKHLGLLTRQYNLVELMKLTDKVKLFPYV